MHGEGDRLLPLSRRKTWRDRDPLSKLLREWHGATVASDIIQSRLPREVRVGEAVDLVLSRLALPEEYQLHRLRQAWAEVVGGPIAHASEPHHLHRGVLYIAVRGASMRMELSRFHADTILAKIQAHSGADFCQEIRFVAEG